MVFVRRPQVPDFEATISVHENSTQSYKDDQMVQCINATKWSASLCLKKRTRIILKPVTIASRHMNLQLSTRCQCIHDCRKSWPAMEF